VSVSEKSSAGRRLRTITVDQAISSASNVLVSVLAARALGVSDFGWFGLVLITYVATQGAARALVGEPLLVRPVEAESRPGEAIGTAMVLSGAIALIVTAAGALTALVQRDLGLGLVALGVFLPLIFLQDLGRYLAFATHHPGRALVLDLTWLGLLVVAVGAVLVSGSQSLVWFVVAWAGSGAVAGLLTPLPYRHAPDGGGRIRLGLGWLRETWPFSWRYALSFASMQSASLGASIAIVGIAGARALGAVRGALLLLGPFTQLQAASIAAGVAEVSRMEPGSDAVARHVRRTTSLTVGVALANAVVLLVLPDVLGRLVLGATWEPTQRLLWPACLQMVMLGLISGVRSALLGLRAVRTTTTLDIVGTAVTLGLTVIGAFVNGSLGAFWFLAGGQAVVAMMWWATYLGRGHHAIVETTRSEQVPC
jgi:O-antigen/teichoic acid export membrane protein